MNSSHVPADRREIRVFISSTFRDMMRERDVLVKRVFPELRRKCAKRFVTFTEVDLRWGITEEQASEGQVLPLCLAEIERSRPYFLGLLGERYGWIPDTIPPEIVEREPWLKEHVQDRTSVTELEILHGVLNDPNMAGHTFFFFRDPAFVNDPSLSDDERRELGERNIASDIKMYGETEATRRTEERKARLAALKQRIRDSGLPLVEPYANPGSLAEIVVKQFDELIDRLYPEDQTPDPLTQERMAHEAHAKNKLFGCIERPAHMNALTDFADRADTAGKGLVLTGESGGGKTALLAAWAHEWARDNPDDWLFQHYFGATPESASPEGFLRRLMGEMKQRFGIAEDIPADPENLRDALPVWLAMAPSDVQIALVLDGLDQVHGGDPDRCLGFLPRHFPPHVTVIASALPGLALDGLRERGWTEYELPRATEAEADAMAAEFLRQIGRFVNAEGQPIETPLRRQIVAAPGSRNPLFLRTVLEELRQFGGFEKLPERVAYYLEARDPKELFLRVIRRWQEDFDGKDPEGRDRDLVRRALTHLWAARQGLSESEWLDLLGHRSLTTDQFSPLPRALWTPLFLALEPHLSQREGLFAYGHDFLRQAAEQAWLTQPDAQRAAHLAVADYFECHPNQADMTDRKAAEWSFQLHAARAWARLEACLTHIPLFLALYNERTKWDLTGYWHPLRAKPLNRDMGMCYSAAYGSWTGDRHRTADDFVQAQLGEFLADNGRYDVAKSFLHGALGIRERVWGKDHPETMKSANALATLLAVAGDPVRAQSLYERALLTRERTLGIDHPDTIASMNNLASLLVGDLAAALPLFERAASASERVLGPEHPDTAICLNNLGFLLAKRGDLARARAMVARSVEIRRISLGPDHPTTLKGMGNLASLLFTQGNCADARLLFAHISKISERILGPEHPDTLVGMNNLACVLERFNDFAGARTLYERVIKGREQILGIEHASTLGSVMNLVTMLERQGDFASARSWYERVLTALLRISVTPGGAHPQLQAFIKHYSDCLGKLGLVDTDIHVQLNALAQPLKKSPHGATGGADKPRNRTSPELRAALDTMIRDNLSRQDIATKLQRDDPALFAELQERIRRGQEEVAESRWRAALMAYKRGDYRNARHLLEQVLAAGYRVPDAHCELARIALVTDDFAAVHTHTDQAWARHAEAPPPIIPRILWLKLAAALRDNDTPSAARSRGDSTGLANPGALAATLLCQLNLVLAADEAYAEWNMRHVLDHLKPYLTPGSHALLSALIAAMNDKAKLAELDAFEAWRESGREPLE